MAPSSDPWPTTLVYPTLGSPNQCYPPITPKMSTYPNVKSTRCTPLLLVCGGTMEMEKVSLEKVSTAAVVEKVRRRQVIGDGRGHEK